MASSLAIRSFKTGFSALRFSAVQCNKISYTPLRTLVTTQKCLSDRKFNDKHEWVQVTDGIGTIGITNYAQESLGDIVYAQLPEIDSEYSQGEEIGALESVKAASELYSPVSGKVVEVNSEVEEQPSLINKSCYESGWLFKMKLSKPDETANLMDEAGYEKYVKALDS